MYYDGNNYHRAILYTDPERATLEQIQKDWLDSEEELMLVVPLLNDSVILTLCPEHMGGDKNTDEMTTWGKK